MAKQKKGFTLVELSLGTAFLAILLLMIATIVISTSSIFQKGISLRNVNATGRNLVDEFSRAITSAPLSDIPVDDKGNIEESFYFKQRTGKVAINRVNAEDQDPSVDNPEVQLSGVFCSGQYSYLWNTGYVLNGDRFNHNFNPLTFYYNGTPYQDDFYLLKIPDPEREACQKWDGGDNLHISSPISAPYPEELLTQTERQMQLALYEMTIFPVIQDTASWRTFYTGTFVLSTIAGDVNIKSGDNHCDPSNNRSLTSDFSYCAVNKFNFSAQASGQVE